MGDTIVRISIDTLIPCVEIRKDTCILKISSVEVETSGYLMVQ